MKPLRFAVGFGFGVAVGVGSMLPRLSRLPASSGFTASSRAAIERPRSDLLMNETATHAASAVTLESETHTAAAAAAATFANIVALGESTSRERQLDKFFQAWVVRDAVAAANFAQAIADDDLRKGALIRVMQTWAVQDAPAALAWAKDSTFAFPNDRETAMSTACTWVSYSDPREALQYALEYKVETGAQGMLLQSLTERWAERDMAAVRDWVARQPASEQREKFVEGVARALVQIDPAEGARYVLEQIPPGENQNSAALAVLCQWALKDLEGASAWVERFPAGTLRDQAMQQLAATLER